MNEKMIHINGIDICTESFGDSTHPAVLLIMGATASMIWWDEEFCKRLADKGRFVIRYDNRDVGRSHTYEPGTCPYTVEDMVEDAVGVLDAYHIEQAHLVGMSLGGLIAQIVALRYPQRVETLTLMMTGMVGPGNREFPPMDERILDYHAEGAKVDWSDEQAVAHYMVDGGRLLSGSKHIFDEKKAYKLAINEIKRANNLRSMFNHALLKSNASYDGKLKEIHVPALIIHGTEDTIWPYEHGLALEDEITNSVLLTLEGTGHEFHYDDWDTIIDAMINHTLVVG